MRCTKSEPLQNNSEAEPAANTSPGRKAVSGSILTCSSSVFDWFHDRSEPPHQHHWPILANWILELPPNERVLPALHFADEFKRRFYSRSLPALLAHQARACWAAWLVLMLNLQLKLRDPRVRETKETLKQDAKLFTGNLTMLHLCREVQHIQRPENAILRVGLGRGMREGFEGGYEGNGQSSGERRSPYPANVVPNDSNRALAHFRCWSWSRDEFQMLSLLFDGNHYRSGHD
ncbi:hypothetical protein EV126DRAFT_153036 [Verticillium dahliae]|nr:hypothetical protein EV126DRAFT_153036 [Verticillium dahliae]